MCHYPPVVLWKEKSYPGSNKHRLPKWPKSCKKSLGCPQSPVWTVVPPLSQPNSAWERLRGGAYRCTSNQQHSLIKTFYWVHYFNVAWSCLPPPRVLRSACKRAEHQSGLPRGTRQLLPARAASSSCDLFVYFLWKVPRKHHQGLLPNLADTHWRIFCF